MTIDATILRSAETLLRESQRILIVSHLVPDADAYGSTVGLSRALITLGKEVSVAIAGGDDRKHRCVPGVELVRDTLPPLDALHLVVYSDCADEKRVGDAFAAVLKDFSGPILNIDHHITNTEFGRVNLVDAKASSTCEIIAVLLRSMGCTVDKDTATALLTGIIGDTGGFRYSSTSPDTLLLASELYRAGGDLPGIAQQLFSTTSLSSVRLQALALQNLLLDEDGKIAGAYLDQERYAAANATPDDVEALVEMIRDIEGVEVAYSIRWTDEIWKVSLRSLGSLHDVAKVAASFGGGGHRAAAAFRYRGTLDSLLVSLRKQLSDLVREG